MPLIRTLTASLALVTGLASVTLALPASDDDNTGSGPNPFAIGLPNNSSAYPDDLGPLTVAIGDDSSPVSAPPEPPSNDDPAALSFRPDSNADVQADAAARRCIPFHFDAPANIFHRADGAFAGPCKSGKGSFSCCINGIGAIFFAANNAGTLETAATKFECNFPGDGSGWCNWSVVDGVSTTAQCTFPNSASKHKVIGGGDFHRGGKCPVALTPNRNCRNTGGHGVANKFFSNKVTGGLYWFQDSISDVMANWGNGGPGASPVQCKIGKMVF